MKGMIIPNKLFMLSMLITLMYTSGPVKIRITMNVLSYYAIPKRFYKTFYMLLPLPFIYNLANFYQRNLYIFSICAN